MGARGPAPRREETLARPRARKGKDQAPVTKGVARNYEIPDPDENWHPVARRLWDSLWESGQADLYQQSDVAFAYYMVHQVNIQLRVGRLSGPVLSAIDGMMTKLLITAGDRARIRLELDKPETNATPASVTAIADYKRGLGVAI